MSTVPISIVRPGARPPDLSAGRPPASRLASSPGPVSTHAPASPRRSGGHRRLPAQPGAAVFCLGSRLAAAGSALAVLASVKMIVPGCSAGVSWLTFGRVHAGPARSRLCMAGRARRALALGSGCWPVCAGCRFATAAADRRVGALEPRRHARASPASSTATAPRFSGLEFPRYASRPAIFTAFVFIALWAVLMFRYRREGAIYISQWYSLAAFLWFPWIYATANLVHVLPARSRRRRRRSSLRGIAHIWSACGLCRLALAIAYYVVPKSTGHPVHRYTLASSASGRGYSSRAGAAWYI